MKDEAGKAVHKKIKGVEGEQGAAKSAGSDAPGKNFGHSSAKSAGVSGQIPVGDGNPGGGKSMKGY